MLTVHHLRISQSERIVWLCKELGIEYDLKLYDRRSDNRLAPDEYKALHPMGMAPVIEDDSGGSTLVLGESGAIAEYIVAKYGNGRLVPAPEHPDFAQHLFWFHFANATFMASAMMALSAQQAGTQELPPFVTARINKAWNHVEARLGETPYFGGSELTTADIMMVFQLTTLRLLFENSIEDMPNLQVYLKRIGERPAYQKAMAKAEPGMPPKID